MVHFVRGWADLGALTRNDKSEVMATRICGKHCLEDVEITEAMAILVGTVMAKSAGLQPLIIESDSFSVIKMISREVVTNGEISWIIEELGNLTFDGRRILVSTM